MSLSGIDDQWVLDGGRLEEVEVGRSRARAGVQKRERERIAMCGEKARSSSPGASPDKNQMNVLPLTVVRGRWTGGGEGKVVY